MAGVLFAVIQLICRLFPDTINIDPLCITTIIIGTIYIYIYIIIFHPIRSTRVNKNNVTQSDGFVACYILLIYLRLPRSRVVYFVACHVRLFLARGIVFVFACAKQPTRVYR